MIHTYSARVFKNTFPHRCCLCVRESETGQPYPFQSPAESNLTLFGTLTPLGPMIITPGVDTVPGPFHAHAGGGAREEPQQAA